MWSQIFLHSESKKRRENGIFPDFSSSLKCVSPEQFTTHWFVDLILTSLRSLFMDVITMDVALDLFKYSFTEIKCLLFAGYLWCTHNLLFPEA